MVDGSDLIWTALGLVFVIEGLMPFISPAGWPVVAGLDDVIEGPLWGRQVTG